MTSDLAPVAVLDGQFVNVVKQSSLMEAVRDRLRSGAGFTVFTLNLDHMVKRRADPAFAAAYARATFVTADGAPVAALARRQGSPVVRTTGADLVIPVCAEAAHAGAPIFLFGTDKASLRAAAGRLRGAFPDLIIAGQEAPPIGFDPLSKAAAAAGARICASGARLCFVALGAPKQELFSDALAQRYPELGFLCIGASLDFLAGSQRRAPRLVRALCLEWAWRLLSNPSRMAGRYAKCFALLAGLLLLGVNRRSPQSSRRPKSLA